MINISCYYYQLMEQKIEVLHESLDDIYYPSFSPDGKKIIFSGKDHGNGNMWVFRTADAIVYPLNSAGRNGFYCDWSPDGKWLAFQSHTKNSLSSNIYVMPSIGGRPVMVTDPSLVSAARTVSWALMEKHYALPDTLYLRKVILQ